MKRRKTYIIRNEDEGWTYVGFDDYTNDAALLSMHARNFKPGVREMDIVVKNWVAGKESPPHFVVGTIMLDEPRLLNPRQR